MEEWGPVGAFIGWTISPEYWDDQPFILVDYLPLRRRIMAETLTTRLKAIADKSTTADDEKALVAKARRRAGDNRCRADRLPPRLQAAVEDKKTIAEIAAKLSEEHKWLTPRELEEARITDKDHAHPFIDWASELQEQKRQFNANPQSAARLTELERRAIEVGHAAFDLQGV